MELKLNEKVRIKINCEELYSDYSDLFGTITSINEITQECFVVFNHKPALNSYKVKSCFIPSYLITSLSEYIIWEHKPYWELLGERIYLQNCISKDKEVYYLSDEIQKILKIPYFNFYFAPDQSVGHESSFTILIKEDGKTIPLKYYAEDPENFYI